MGELSPKERQALELEAQGLTVEQIGERMMLSPHAVRVFLTNGKRKR